MSQITWSISELRVHTNIDELKDVVVSCKWTATGTKGTFTMTIDGEEEFTPPSIDKFVEYDDLTEEVVLGWLFDTMLNKEAIERQMVETLTSRTTPEPEVKPLPWEDA